MQQHPVVHRHVGGHEHVRGADDSMIRLDPAGVAVVHVDDARILVQADAARRRLVQQRLEVGGRMHLRLVIPSDAPNVSNGSGTIPIAPDIRRAVELVGEPLDVLLPLGIEEARHVKIRTRARSRASPQCDRSPRVSRCDERGVRLAEILGQRLIPSVDCFGEVTRRVAGFAAGDVVPLDERDPLAAARQQQAAVRPEMPPPTMATSVSRSPASAPNRRS